LSERITDSDLERALKRLNDVSKVNYEFNNAYGYSQLAHTLPSEGGISTVSNGNTKKELYYQIQFALDILSNEKQKRFNKFNCRHRDEFNRFDGERDCTMIYVSKDDKRKTTTYHCRACGQNVSQQAYEKSKIPITYEAIKKEVELLQVRSKK